MFHSTLYPSWFSYPLLFLVLTLALALGTAAQQPAPVPAPTPAPAPAESQQPSTAGDAARQTPETKPVAKTAEKPKTLKQKAWGILSEGLENDSTDKRARAASILGMLPGNREAESAAIKALKDDKSSVRLAAASALGSMQAVCAKPALQDALEDSEPAVVLAAANSLLLLQDNSGYDVYYAILTGEKRANKGMIKEQLQTLKDKKKMAEMGLEEGLGFIPFAGIGYTVLKTVMKDDASPVRAAAAKKLAHDSDPSSAEALVVATQDKNWAVRVAALEAISQRGDKALVPKIAAAMEDEKEIVRLAAAACLIHLTQPPARKAPAKSSPTAQETP
jgi:HEAT repeat protein